MSEKEQKNSKTNINLSDDQLQDKYVDYCMGTMGDTLSFDQWKKTFFKK